MKPGATTHDHKREKDFLTELEAELHNKAVRATKMQLLIKNNLTIIESVQLKGYGTSAMLELVDVRKDFIRVTEGADRRAAPVVQTKRVSVADMYKYELTTFKNISAAASMDVWNDLKVEEQQNGFIRNISQFLRKSEWTDANLHKHLAGSELYVINHLFDEQTQAEYFRKQKQSGKDLTVT